MLAGRDQTSIAAQVLVGRDQTSIAEGFYVGRDQTSIAAQVSRTAGTRIGPAQVDIVRGSGCRRFEETMKRSNFTHYVTDDTLIYEYKNALFVLERCQQGQVLNPTHGSRQFPADVSGLTARLDIPCTALELGQAVLKALDDFDTRGHPYGKFDFPARNKFIAGLVGARGMPSLERDSRVVQVIRSLEKETCSVYPFDNNNLHPWNGPVEELKITLPAAAFAEEIGAAVLKAFSLSTHHPGSLNAQ